ncbi:MAG: phytoene/squalene synthase family protein [Planctomycetota bacterium]|nr:phytoene/squalene synthase family protein [Planctomycetota bacterium]
MGALERSYAHCGRVARLASSNFYYCLFLLPVEKRQAMYALYAFLRQVDDIADGPAAETSDGPVHSDADCQRRLVELATLRENLHRSLTSEVHDPILPALADTVRRYGIPTTYLDAAIDGVSMDLHGERYETFDELSIYCQRVAGVVGQACIHIWGFNDPRALELAVPCGLAFQLTNILRDLKDDALQGRVYLPAEDLRRFEYTADELRAGVRDARFRRLMQFQIARAEQLYGASQHLGQMLHADGRRVFLAMFRTYHRLLEEICLAQGDVFSRRVSLSLWQKATIALGSIWPRSGMSYTPVDVKAPSA